MYQARLKGSYYEMGYQQGEMMRRGTLPPIWSDSFHETVDAGRTEFSFVAVKKVATISACIHHPKPYQKQEKA
jgi:hypothetical protein